MKSIKEKTFLTVKSKKEEQLVKTLVNTLLLLSASFGTLSIVFHATVVGITIGFAGAFLTVVFSLKAGIVKNLLRITRKKKKKHNKIVMLAKSKLNRVETLMPQASIDLDI